MTYTDIQETTTKPTPTLEEALSYLRTMGGDYSGGLAEHRYATPEEIAAYYGIVTDYLGTDHQSQGETQKTEGTLDHLIHIQMMFIEEITHPLQTAKRIMEIVTDLGKFDCQLDPLTDEPYNLN